MAFIEPFDQLLGALTIYIAPVGTSIPAVNTTPSGDWVELGATDGEQSLQHSGKLTHYRDNDHQGPVKGTRPEEDIVAAFTLVSLTLEHQGRILDQASDVVEDSGPPATKTLPLKRGPVPNEYAMLLKGEALSPYGALPGMYVLPRGVFDNEPQLTFGKDNRAEVECEFTVWEDDDQADDADKMGWLVVQTA